MYSCLRNKASSKSSSQRTHASRDKLFLPPPLPPLRSSLRSVRRDVNAFFMQLPRRYNSAGSGTFNEPRLSRELSVTRWGERERKRQQGKRRDVKSENELLTARIAKNARPMRRRGATRYWKCIRYPVSRKFKG